MNKTYERCILICAGDLEVSRMDLRESDLIVAVDGGFMYCDALGLTPDLLLGDFDSVDEKYRQRVAQLETECPEMVRRLPPEKDDSDTLAAVRFVMDRYGIKDFVFYAACGGRLDHTISNLQTLLYIKRQGGKGYIFDGSSMILVAKDESISFQKDMMGTLSVFAFGGVARGVTETGLKYTLDHVDMRPWEPIGLSNEFIGETATVSVEDGVLLLLARWE